MADSSFTPVPGAQWFYFGPHFTDVHTEVLRVKVACKGHTSSKRGNLMAQVTVHQGQRFRDLGMTVASDGTGNRGVPGKLWVRSRTPQESISVKRVT